MLPYFDPRQLPSQPLKYFHLLPAISAVYFIIAPNGLFVYIGSTTNLKRRPIDPTMRIRGRWAEAFRLVPGATVHWLQWDAQNTIEQMRCFEAECIQHFHPLLNIQHNISVALNESISLDFLRARATANTRQRQADYQRFFHDYRERLWRGFYATRDLYHANDNFRDDDEMFDAFSCFLSAFDIPELSALANQQYNSTAATTTNNDRFILWVMFSFFGQPYEEIRYIGSTDFFDEDMYGSERHLNDNDNWTDKERRQIRFQGFLFWPVVIVLLPVIIYHLCRHGFRDPTPLSGQVFSLQELSIIRQNLIHDYWKHLGRHIYTDTNRYFQERRAFEDRLEQEVGLKLRWKHGGRFLDSGIVI